MTSNIRPRRFDRVESEIVWAAIETLDPGLQYEILRELATIFAAASTQPGKNRDKVRRAVFALHDATDVLGHAPSLPEYRRLRSTLPELELPQDSNIRKWLGGGWNHCLARAGLDAVSDGDFASHPVGLTDRFDDEGVLAAVRDCSRDLGHAPSSTEYFPWARSPEVMARPGRRPRGYRAFERLGGFRAALVKAGVIEPDEARYASNGRVIPASYAYEEHEMTDALLLVAGRLDKSPQRGDYDGERNAILAESKANGATKALPTGAIIRDHFGSWNDALKAVGLPPVQEREPWFTGKNRPTYTDDEMLRRVEQAWVAVGEPLTANAYRKWRRQMVASGDTLIPQVESIERRFGSWTQAVKLARPTGHTEESDAAE